MARSNMGIVYLVDIAARLLVTTRAKAAIVAIMRLNDAPFSKTIEIAIGEMTAAINIIEIPTHAT
ncbi:MAG TPA: hypothetical protein VKR32_19140 [Puia sp.]|nr:hypothetical protein [Puia sp.]